MKHISRIVLLLSFCCVLFACRAERNKASEVSRLLDVSLDNQFQISIAPSVAEQIDEPRLKNIVRSSLKKFQEDFFPLHEVLNISVGMPGCLRTGYNFEAKVVQFCSNARTPASGTQSEDVVHHEMFHAMLCQQKPDWCTAEKLKVPENVALHETLADLFARRLNPDDSFGESFYSDQQFIRSYQSDACYNLVESPYGKASALMSHIWSKQDGFDTVVKMLRGNDFSADELSADGDDCFRPDGPAVQVRITNQPESRLSRYRVRASDSLDLQIVPNEALLEKFPNLKIQWTFENDIFAAQDISTAQDAFHFKVVSQKPEGWSKATAHFWAESHWLGAKTFYFAVANGQH